MFGLVERNGRIVAIRVRYTIRAMVMPKIHKTVIKNPKLITDEHTSYRMLSSLYDHEMVNHSAREYVIGESRTNTIEGL